MKGRQPKGEWNRARAAARTKSSDPPEEPKQEQALFKPEQKPAMIPTKTVAIINTIYAAIWLAVEIIKALSKP
jgi:hypothetical protein